jgi:hypothetical protein
VKRQGLPKPKEHQHDFGGVFGGPIQRDRTFVFVSYEGLRLDQPRSLVTEVPSLASRAAASDALKPIFAAFPLPNGPDTSSGLAQFSASYSDPSTLNATSVRVDRTFGNALTVFGRYNYAPSEAASRLGSFAIASANTVGTLQNSLQTVTVGATSIVTSTLSNELRVNWSRNVGTNFQTLDSFGGAMVLPATTLHPAFVPPNSAYQVNLGPANVLFADGLNASNVQRQINIIDSVQLIRARHQLKFGIDYRRFFPIYGPLNYVQAYTLNGVAGALAGRAQDTVTSSDCCICTWIDSNNQDWDGLRELVAADARLRVADRFAGSVTNAPYFANYQRLIGEWRLAVGDVDGEPAVILLQRGADAWVPRSLVHLDITDGRITRIADFWHTPWILQTASSVAIAEREP